MVVAQVYATHQRTCLADVGQGLGFRCGLEERREVVAEDSREDLYLCEFRARRICPFFHRDVDGGLTMTTVMGRRIQ